MDSLRYRDLPLSVISRAAYKIYLATRPGTKQATVNVSTQAKQSVLLIGDSISIGYTDAVALLLSDRYRVDRVPVNSLSSARVLAGLDEWLTKQYAAIYFNAGLHDLKFVENPADIFTEQPGIDVKTGHRWVDPATYEQNVRTIIRKLKKYSPKVIVGTTTPVPEGAKSRRPEDVATYNAVLVKVAHDEGALVDDLHIFVLPFIGTVQRPFDVHFHPVGYQLLAGQVSRAILAAASSKA